MTTLRARRLRNFIVLALSLVTLPVFESQARSFAHRATSAYAIRDQRPRNDLILFGPDIPGLNPYLRDRALDLQPPPKTPTIVPPPPTDELLEAPRQRGRL